MDEQLAALYHRHVGGAFDRQRRLVALLEREAAGGEWAYDPEAATFTFGGLTFYAPVLGTHAPDDTWLWAWANPRLALTPGNRDLAGPVGALARRLDLPDLDGPGFPLEPLLGPDLLPSAAHVLGTVLSAELGFDAFHTIPHEAGRELVLIRDDRLRADDGPPLARLADTFPQALREMDVPDHRAALAGYARDLGLDVADAPAGLVLRAADGGELAATFDARGRLTLLEGRLPPAPKPAGKSPPKPAAKGPAGKGRKPAAKRPAGKTAPAAKRRPKKR